MVTINGFKLIQNDETVKWALWVCIYALILKTARTVYFFADSAKKRKNHAKESSRSSTILKLFHKHLILCCWEFLQQQQKKRWEKNCGKTMKTAKNALRDIERQQQTVKMQKWKNSKALSANQHTHTQYTWTREKNE